MPTPEAINVLDYFDVNAYLADTSGTDNAPPLAGFGFG